MMDVSVKFGTKTATLPKISVILVSYNRKDILEKCLQALYRQKFREFEVVFVDNASTDGTGRVVLDLFPEVRYFRLESNTGPAGGRNFGVKMASSEICLFLDDDAFFTHDGALKRVFEYFETDPDLSCLAFRIIRPDKAIEEYKSIPRADKKRINKDYECSYFCGAGFACRRRVFSVAGMFWEKLFFTGEELDLSYRLIEKGHKIIRSYSICIIHDETPLARVPGKWIYFGMRSRFWLAVRNLPWLYVVSHSLLWWGYYLIFALRTRHPVFFAKGFRDALAGLPSVLRFRQPISGETINRLKRLSGRVYY